MFALNNKVLKNAAVNMAIGLSVIWLLAEFLGVETMLGEEIKANLAIYAISRAMNAAVSLLQSTEISVVVANIDIGEILDPVNDAIERFSTVLTWATASLMVQKLTITLVGSNTYKAIATLTALLSFALVAFGPKSCRVASMAKAGFTFFVWLKLAAVLAVWFSISVAGQVIGQSLVAAESDLKSFKLEAGQLQGLLTGTFEADAETGMVLGEQRAKIMSDTEAEQVRFAELDAKISDLQGQLDAAQPERSWKDRMLNPFGREDTPQLQSLEAALVTLKEQKQASEFELTTLQADLECVDKQLAGETCQGVMGRLSAFMDGVESLARKSPELILSLLNVIAAVIFKNLLAPIALAFGTLRYGPAWVAGRRQSISG